MATATNRTGSSKSVQRKNAKTTTKAQATKTTKQAKRTAGTAKAASKRTATSAKASTKTTATEAGKTTAYSLFSIQERSTLFVGAGVPVYEGQVIGENRRANDMNVNAVRAKKLTNIRAAGKDEATILTPAREVEIEWALEWLEDDELLEVTPQSLRLRKRVLSGSFRKR